MKYNPPLIGFNPNEHMNKIIMFIIMKGICTMPNLRVTFLPSYVFKVLPKSYEGNNFPKLIDIWH